jgi:hypothetical protein
MQRIAAVTRPRRPSRSCSCRQTSSRAASSAGRDATSAPSRR